MPQPGNFQAPQMLIIQVPLTAMLPLPAGRFEACEKTTVRVRALSLVRYRTNEYSVPTQYGQRQVLVKGDVDRVLICSGSEGIVIQEHS